MNSLVLPKPKEAFLTKERVTELREKASNFIGDVVEGVLMGPFEKVLDWVEDKPTIVKALGAYVVTPALVVGETVGATLLVLHGSPAVAVGAVVVGTYAWLQTVLAGEGMHDDIFG